MTHSLRFRLAARTALGITAALAVMSLLGLYGARVFLDRELNANLLSMASIQASSVTDAAAGDMNFHEWDLTPDEAAKVRELNRYAQVWSATGESLLRTQYITQDLPLDNALLRRAAAGEMIVTNQRFQELPIRSLYYPLERMGAAHARHVLQVAAPLTARNRMLGQLAWLLLGITLLSGAASFFGGWWLALRIVQPVHEITDQAEAIRAGTLGKRIAAHADAHEYERLVDVLNSMLARLESSFEAQRRFTADASHELRSPLTALRGEIELALRRDRDQDEYRRVLASSLEEVDRLTQLVQNLLTLARSDAGVMQPRLQATRPGERAEAILTRLQPAAAQKGLILRLESSDSTEILVDPFLLDQLLWNLVDNAVRFTPTGGEVVVTLSPSAAGLDIEVADTGSGVSEDDRERIFERFYRADHARTVTGEVGGTGLGLSIVRAIVDVHGGQVSVSNRPSSGAVFRATFPVVPRTAMRRARVSGDRNTV